MLLGPLASGKRGTAGPTSAEDQGSPQAKTENKHIPGQSCSEGQMALANIEDEAVQPGQGSVCQPQLGCEASDLQLC